MTSLTMKRLSGIFGGTGTLSMSSFLLSEYEHYYTMLFLAIAGFSYKYFKYLIAPRKIIYFIVDLSASALEALGHQNVQTKHCKVSQRNQKVVVDYGVVISFADKAEVVNDCQIKNQLDVASCDFDTSGFGKLPGTSVLNPFRWTNTVIKGYRARGVDYPLVFSQTLSTYKNFG